MTRPLVPSSRYAHPFTTTSSLTLNSPFAPLGRLWHQRVDHLMLFGTCAEWSRNNLPPALRQQLALPSFREGKRFMGISTVPGPAGVTIDQDSKLPVFGP